MKIKRIAVMIIAIMLFNMQFVCNAQQPSYTQNKYLFDEKECNLVYDELLGLLPYDSGVSNPAPRSFDDVSICCRLYYINSNPLEVTKQKKNFDACLEEIPHWTMVAKDGSEAIARLENGKYTVFEMTYPTGTIKYGLDFNAVSKAIESLGANLNDENLLIKFVNTENYGIYRIFYINYKEKEYFIPCSFFNGTGGFENGKLYEMSQLLDYIETKNSEKKILEEEKEKYNGVIYLVVGICFTVLLTSAIIILKRKATSRE